MALYASLHMDPDEPCDITCTHLLNSLKPEGYAVLWIGTLTIYPTRERLERLRAVISAYLAAHGDEPDGSADPGDIVPLPAEAVTGCEGLRCPKPHCGSRDLIPARGVDRTLWCKGCGCYWPEEECRPSAPVPARASMRVDADDLLIGMASSYNVRREPWEGA